MGSVRPNASVGNGTAIARPHAPLTQTILPVSLVQLFAEVIRLVVMMCVRFPMSLRNVEDLRFERGIDMCRETVRQWWTGSARCSPATSAASGSVAYAGFASGDDRLCDLVLKGGHAIAAALAANIRG